MGPCNALEPSSRTGPPIAAAHISTVPFLSSSLRLHFLIDTLATGGAEALLVDFFEQAPSFGIDASVGYLNDEESFVAERLRAIGVEPELVRINSLLGRRDRELVRHHLADVAPDLVHTHLGASDLLGGLAAHALDIPYVSTVHSAEYAQTIRERVKERMMAEVRRRYASKVILVSEAARRRYLADRKDRADHVLTIRNGIAGTAQPGSGREVRRALGLSPDDLVLIVIGVMRKGKNQELAAAAVQKLLPTCPNLKLLVVGDGDERPAIERAVAPLGEAAVLTGFRDDVLELLDASDILVHPSRADALPTALIEAMAAGVPAVATAVGGVPELVADGVTGVLFPPPPSSDRLAETIRPLLDDPGLRQRMGSAGRGRFEREFTVGQWMRRLLTLYEEVLELTGPTPDKIAS